MAATFDVSAMKIMGDYTSDEGRAIHNESLRKKDYSRYTGLRLTGLLTSIFFVIQMGDGDKKLTARILF